MVKRRKIFIGSSSEALGMAVVVGDVIQRAGMEPVLWKDVFPAGDILLGRIEQLPSEVDGVVLLATPDLVCIRKSRKERFSAPVANVVFEHGYLSGRLSRKRVAICAFEEADMPSDLQGLTIVRAGSYDENKPLALSIEAETSLQQWLTSLVPLATGIPPMRRVHGYSGIWEVQNKFSLWHGITIEKPDRVFWDGKTILHVEDDGERGSGSQMGVLKVTLGQYQAIWNVANKVVRATVDRDGSLTMHVEVYTRDRVDHTGTPPSERVHEELPVPGWDLKLNPVRSKRRKLEGTHVFRVAGSPYSIAKEYYTYADM